MDFISEKIAEYLSQNSEKEPEILSKLNRETHQKVLQPRMLSGHIQGRFLSLISKIKSPLVVSIVVPDANPSLMLFALILFVA